MMFRKQSLRAGVYLSGRVPLMHETLGWIPSISNPPKSTKENNTKHEQVFPFYLTLRQIIFAIHIMHSRKKMQNTKTCSYEYSQ